MKTSKKLSVIDCSTIDMLQWRVEFWADVLAKIYYYDIINTNENGGLWFELRNTTPKHDTVFGNNKYTILVHKSIFKAKRSDYIKLDWDDLDSLILTLHYNIPCFNRSELDRYVQNINRDDEPSKNTLNGKIARFIDFRVGRPVQSAYRVKRITSLH